MIGFLPPWLEEYPVIVYGIYGAIAFLALAVLITLYLIFGKGPRFSRSAKSATQLIAGGQLEDGWAVMKPWAGGKLSRGQTKRLNTIKGSYLQKKAEIELKDKKYEQALTYLEESFPLTGKQPEQARAFIISRMMDEAHRLFASAGFGEQTAVQEMLSRILLIDSKCGEAFFWKALSFLKDNKTEEATRILREMVFPGQGEQLTDMALGSEFSEKCIDPPMYLGALLIQQGQPKEALRSLTEANRVDGNCPFVISQMGVAMIESGGDMQFAIRTLQRALGPRGFGEYTREPKRAWVDALPENLSYVRRMASLYPFICPVWGEDFLSVQRQGRGALAKAYFRLGQFKDAVQLYEKLVEVSAPSLDVLRGLGISLAKMEKYDEAFKHLRSAHELENPKDPTTTGYFALCGAKGKPANPEDKANNVSWAVWLVRDYKAPGNREWVSLLQQIHEEAREAKVALAVEDRVHLCEHLASLDGADESAAHAYGQLYLQHPQAFQPQWGWLFSKAVEQRDLDDPRLLEILQQVFREEASAREFFEAKKWIFASTEYSFLKKSSQHQPGQVPEVFGEQGPQRVSTILAERVDSHQAENEIGEAQETANVWAALLPNHPQALDRLAHLQYLNNDSQGAIVTLQRWHEATPHDPVPLTRLAVLAQQQQRWDDCRDSLHKALEHTSGAARGKLALLGARLLLARWRKAATQTNVSMGNLDELQDVRHLLQISLEADGDNGETVTLLSGVLILQKDREALAGLKPRLEASLAHYPNNRLLIGLYLLLAEEYDAVLPTVQPLAETSVGSTDAAYLSGWALLLQNQPEKAALSFLKVSLDENSASRVYAKALLGCLRFFQGDSNEAVELWKQLNKSALQAFELTQPLGQIIFHTALQDLQAGEYASASEKLREAGKVGYRDPRLGPLLSMSLFKAGQALMRD